MIIIYAQDKTYIRNDADAAKDVFISVYGEKIGKEAYSTMINAKTGMSYRKNGGPLIQIVTKEDAAVIREKETAIGMM